jgi:membrane protein DedA with SNARE-associated domain
MSSSIIITISNLIIHIITKFSYTGIFLFMTLESLNIPIPSEVVMTFSGFLVSFGKLNFYLVVIIGTLGNLLGSVLSYYIGTLGEEFLEKYGKYLFISKADLKTAHLWFLKYGDMTILVSRFLPVFRTFISFPAGIARMNFKKFILYTFIGSLIWSIVLTYIGFLFGSHWQYFAKIIESLSNYILIVTILGLIFLIVRHVRNVRKE